MTRHTERRRRSASESVVPLLVLFVGISAALWLYYGVGGFQPLELALMVVAVAFAAMGYRHKILRGLMSAVFVYIATGVAATFYLPAAPFVGAPFGDQVTDTIRALSFLVLTAAVWILLEIITRAIIPETSLPEVRFLDNLGGLVVYLAVGVVVVSLLFNAAGYVPRLRQAHDQAQFRPRFNQVIALLATSQSFWFRGELPRIYTYDLS